MELELIADYQCVTGEGPLWHEAEQRLYWGDIPQGRLFRFDPASGAHEQVYQAGPGEQIGGFTIQADGALLLFMDRGAMKTWRNGQVTTIVEEIAAERNSRFNDVIADPQGRVYCGTMPTGESGGRLYRLDRDGTLTCLVEDVQISNGMGFTPDRRQMYYTESARFTIWLFNYDRATGVLSDRRAWLRTPPDGGFPDGMAVDAEGHVWSARWDGWALYRFSPTGEQEQRIEFPAKQVSSITFGGPDYADAFVTTAGGHQKDVNGAAAGALFRFRPGVKGQPAFLSRIGL